MKTQEVQHQKGTGREIAGLPTVQEKFSPLLEGRDYTLIDRNNDVVCSRPLPEFFVFLNPSQGTEDRQVKAPHWRTVAEPVSRCGVKLRQEVDGQWVDYYEPYFEVSVKGVGFLQPSVKERKWDEEDTWLKADEPEHDFGYKHLGLSSRLEYELQRVIPTSRFLASAGLRTEAYWAVAKLNNVYFKGELTSIEELRKQKVILSRKDYQPAMGVRLLKDNDRIEEARYADDRRSEIFQKAFEVFNREIQERQLNIDPINPADKEDQRRFFSTFVERMGTNIAVLLNTGYIHFRLHSSNITMAAELVDIGTASHWRADPDPQLCKEYNGVRRGHLKDMRDSVRSIKKLIISAKVAGLKVGKKEALELAFLKGFDEAIKPDFVKRIQQTDVESARKWLQAIFHRMIAEGASLPSLLGDLDSTRIEQEWGIEIK
ncbi:MAG: hypothetical protein Q7R83_03855 [bacterium]|nr:hypothetical protein [bacterium]